MLGAAHCINGIAAGEGPAAPQQRQAARLRRRCTKAIGADVSRLPRVVGAEGMALAFCSVPLSSSVTVAHALVLSQVSLVSRSGIDVAATTAWCLQKSL